MRTLSLIVNLIDQFLNNLNQKQIDNRKAGQDIFFFKVHIDFIL